MIVRRDNGKVVEFEEGKYGMLMMVVCDREGKVYDVWITFGSMQEADILLHVIDISDKKWLEKVKVVKRF